ncbi:hypothetical protein KDJ56_08965 [Brevibacillus composti]|uniref:HEXXH motif domain-containing protein n=2 Tax=Brevibacillus composti TaxID=2796470 RepID=A0A7T5ENW4_9BACL|nr:HEXXH motif-containing putative peptide modification protein [Brevibacillus composti]QQE76031.1 hypothetical protein JD108_09275 [Brevibacillus composti]QUO43058.1 hypothetical protein KDJ56_08965 [Brevibacillus composti]
MGVFTKIDRVELNMLRFMKNHLNHNFNARKLLATNESYLSIPLDELILPQQNFEVDNQLYFLNSKEISCNIKLIADVYGDPLSTVKDNFFHVVNWLQSSNIPHINNGILLDFGSKALVSHLISERMIDEEDTLGDQHLFNQDDQEVIKSNMQKALKLIHMLNPDLHSLINQVIGTICFCRKKGYGGGTVSSLIGLIWFNPQPNWTVIDYAENLIHEFVHNSVFIDDMIHVIFPDTSNLTEKEALTTSTILKIKRPIDKAYHSACVSTALMYYYYLLNDQKRVNAHFQPLRNTLAEIVTKNPKYIASRGNLTVQGMINFSNTLNFESISKSLSCPEPIF